MAKTQRKQSKQAAVPTPAPTPAPTPVAWTAQPPAGIVQTSPFPPAPVPPPLVRTFDSGATRSADAGKPDFAGFTDPLVLERFGEYMSRHRVQPDGVVRASDNWKLDIPQTELFKSAFRHFHDWDMERAGYRSREDEESALCGLIFNANAYLRGLLRARGYHKGDV